MRDKIARALARFRPSPVQMAGEFAGQSPFTVATRYILLCAISPRKAMGLAMRYEAQAQARDFDAYLDHIWGSFRHD